MEKGKEIKDKKPNYYEELSTILLSIHYFQLHVEEELDGIFKHV